MSHTGRPVFARQSPPANKPAQNSVITLTGCTHRDTKSSRCSCSSQVLGCLGIAAARHESVEVSKGGGDLARTLCPSPRSCLSREPGEVLWAFPMLDNFCQTACMKNTAVHYSQPLFSRHSLPPFSYFNYFYLLINSSRSIPLYSPRATKIQQYLIFYHSPTIQLSSQSPSLFYHSAETHPAQLLQAANWVTFCGWKTSN